LPYIDIQGTALDQNNWLRSWSNDFYLWYNEIVDRDPGLYATPQYFDLLKTTATTASGNPKDRFHFTYSTAEWRALIQSGEQVGYGAAWSVVESLPPRRIVVAYTEPGSPAARPGAVLERGEIVVQIDTVDAVNGGTQAEVDALIAGLYPASLGETHVFTLRHPHSGALRTVNLQAEVVTTAPVQNVRTIFTNAGWVGYVLFNDHLFSAEQPLIDAFTTLRTAGVTELVLDLRYNGGGSLSIASEVAFMIAGPARTSGQPFERLVFNDKHASINPFTGGPLTPVPFYDTSSTGQPLPTLNLSRVYVLTGATTCSASESIINGLRGVNVEVIQIGSTTCGKPYGFYPTDNCGTTYFSIQMAGLNAAGFGEYGDGFAPWNAAGAGGVRLPGCSVYDDFGRALGDQLEARFNTALDHLNTGNCPAPSGSDVPGLSKPFAADMPESADGFVRKPLSMQNRILDAR
jgi:C-terminal processing protease CtpA/Prc